MGSEEEGGGEKPPGAPTAGWMGRVEDQWRKTKEHAETYPYVWASYVLVYGGLGAWLAYRWRKLRRTEDRVRALQERLRRIVEAEGGGASGADSKPPPSPPGGDSKPPPSPPDGDSKRQ